MSPAMLAPLVISALCILYSPEFARAQPVTAEVFLEAAPAQVQILGGAPTNVLHYEGTVVTGSPSIIEPIPGSYLGPTFHVTRGDRLRVRFANQTGELSIVHWHGLVVPDSMDGHPRFAIPDGEEFVYEFTVLNRAGTYWYHPHPDMLTGGQVFRGLAGLFIVSDPEEAALSLPRGAYDVPLVIQDRQFDSANQFLYDTGGMMGGFLGDRILVNGRPAAVFSVATRVYRLRLLNGSNSRVYKLAWGDGSPVTVIGTDGGLLEASAQRDYVMLAPGERVDLWADFSPRQTGAAITLRSLAFSPGGMGGGSLPNGAAFDVATFSIDRSEAESLTLPATLATLNRHQIGDAENSGNPRTFGISFAGGEWLLNGGTFEMTAVAANEIVTLGDLEVWRLTNTSGMPMMQMPHPIHVHGPQFQVYERTISSSGASNYATVSAGFVDAGWKDTILLMPGESAKVLIRFEPFPGLFNYHCHNLEHEDMGMMRNYRVEGEAIGVDDAGGAAPPGTSLEPIRAATDGAPVSIRYRIDGDSVPVRLAVYDASGRVVREFDEGVRSAGEYARSWDRRSESGRFVGSGVYLVQLTAGGRGIARKAVLIGP